MSYKKDISKYNIEFIEKSKLKHFKYQVAKMRRIKEAEQNKCFHPLRVADKIEYSTFCECLLCEKELDGNSYKNDLYRLILVKKPESFDEKVRLHNFHLAFKVCVSNLEGHHILDIIRVFKKNYESYFGSFEEKIEHAYESTIEHFNEPRREQVKTRNKATIK